ncbi:MAG: polyhydroxyalkanoate synthesis repressor PhaR [Pseudomonadota bacterium]
MSDNKSPRANGRSKSGDDDVITIKKYANRRLYNTATSSYVTLDYLSEMVKSGQEFTVFDAKSGEDITRSVLTQIIFEEESKGQNLLPIQFLRQLIQFYGDNLQNFVPSYLEMSMNAFAQNQEKIRSQMMGAFSGNPAYSFFEETAKQNMALFEQAMQMFGGPMAANMTAAARNVGVQPMGTGTPGTPGSPDANTAAREEAVRAETEIQALKAEIETLRQQLQSISTPQ